MADKISPGGPVLAGGPKFSLQPSGSACDISSINCYFTFQTMPCGFFHTLASYIANSASRTPLAGRRHFLCNFLLRPGSYFNITVHFCFFPLNILWKSATDVVLKSFLAFWLNATLVTSHATALLHIAYNNLWSSINKLSTVLVCKLLNTYLS